MRTSGITTVRTPAASQVLRVAANRLGRQCFSVVKRLLQLCRAAAVKPSLRLHPATKSARRQVPITLIAHVTGDIPGPLANRHSALRLLEGRAV